MPPAPAEPNVRIELLLRSRRWAPILADGRDLTLARYSRPIATHINTDLLQNDVIALRVLERILAELRVRDKL